AGGDGLGVRDGVADGAVHVYHQYTVRIEGANDPFFGRSGRLLASGQRAAELKFELLVEAVPGRSTAVASGNWHQDHFGGEFGIRSADGEPAHSACFGFGLERIMLALVARHGFRLADWPADVRNALQG
ncbi:MAG: hypothetical protein L0G87_18070, partial [Renibacterium salmoninarum]|nr:hypothetical protein [Renibacterium salmoninarum]